MLPEIPEPWRGFLAELDGRLTSEANLHCHGGFVVAMCYGFERPTGDVDFLAVVPSDAINLLLSSAGKGSPLHQKHKVYLDYFGMIDYPADYEKRLVEMFPGAFRYLRLWALDPYDLALSKLSRNFPRDREDVRYLADKVPLDLAILRSRYETEMRPYLGTPDREDLTLQLWIEDIEERRTQN
jgi:Nucleotidyltransferase of unknown function (DUF6036)